MTSRYPPGIGRWLIVMAAAFMSWMAAVAVGADDHAALSEHFEPAVKPLDEHPGNVFIAGENVSAHLPAGSGPAWQAVDYDGRIVAEGSSGDGVAHLGKLPVGYYEVRGKGGAGRTTVGVLAPLAVRPAESSPIDLDLSMVWAASAKGAGKLQAVASLAALTGANYVGEKLWWGALEPAPGQFSPPDRYDECVAAEAGAGLRIMETNHTTPAWAGGEAKRFPPDLRDAYRFYQAMAQRLRGRVEAFEPWDEADNPDFGGHTGAEIASLQKASYLGLKAGNPDVIVCMNNFALPQLAILDDLAGNEVAPYFDTFNFHHYSNPETYPTVYAAFRRIAAGKPLWVTEFCITVEWTRWSGDVAGKEPSDDALRLQAERVAIAYATGLNEGPAGMFYFMLPDYTEGPVQFGLLHPDLTPRPAYVALAAVGRLLADAKALGRWKSAPAGVTAFMFAAKPDGVARKVLVGWCSKEARNVDLPVVPSALFDHLGRSRAVDGAGVEFKRQPTFVLLPVGATFQGEIERPPISAPAGPKIEPSPIVFQVLLPKADDVSSRVPFKLPGAKGPLWPGSHLYFSRSAYWISGQIPTTIPIYAYNFGRVPVHGELRIAGPAGWKLGIAKTVDLAPGDRQKLDLVIACGGVGENQIATLTLRGEFGAQGRPVLSFRVLARSLPVTANVGGDGGAR